MRTSSTEWPIRLGLVPRMAAGFQPRTDARTAIEEAWSEAEDGATQSPTVLITGPSGVGKTQLAASVFEEMADSADLRIWVRAESRTSIIEALAEAASFIQIALPPGADPVSKSSAFLNWLSSTDRAWLIVFDNAADPAQLRGLLPRGRGKVLITTYRQDAVLHIGSCIRVPLGVFTPLEATEYVEHRLLSNGYPTSQAGPPAVAGAAELAESLGCLPVALAQAMSVVLFHGISCEEYSKLYADRASRLEDLFPDWIPADEYERTLATTWQLAMEQADTLSPEGVARRMMRLAAFIAPTGAPESLFLAQPSLQYLNSVLAPPQHGSMYPSSVTVHKGRSALRILHALSLIDHQGGTGEVVRIHALTQRVIIESIEPCEFSELAFVVSESLGIQWLEADRSTFLTLLANLQHLSSIANDALWSSGIRPVIYLTGVGLLDAGLILAASKHFEWVVAETTLRLGATHPHTLNFRNQLATSYQRSGSIDRAIALFQENLLDCERKLGVYHQSTLSARNNLAGGYQESGQVSLAIPLLEKSLAAAERLRGSKHEQTLILRNNVASAYQEAGDLARALPILEESLADTEGAYGSEHPHTVTSRMNLAVAYKEAGNFEQAIALLRQSIQDGELVMGGDHPAILSCRNNLATAYGEAGDSKRAIAELEKVYPDLQRVLGDRHPYTLACKGNLANAYYAAGLVAKAFPMFKQALAEAELVFGKGHPDTLNSKSNLALAFIAAGNVAKALPLLQQTVHDAECFLDKHHPNTMTWRGNLASALLALGDVENATVHYERNLADRENVLGSQHPDVLGARNNLATAYMTSGDFTRALGLLRDNVSATEKVLGKDHPTTLMARNNLACVYKELKDYNRAIPLFRENLLAMARVMGSDHPKTITSRRNLDLALSARFMQ